MNPENIIQELKKLIEKHEAKDPYTEPWTLGRELPGFRALRDGEEWSRQDFSKEMLEGGWRPCLKGENMQPGDESGECYEKPEGSGPKRWVSVKGLLQTSAHMRTKRPLPILTPQQIAEGWKEHHGGENPAPGRRVSVLLRSGSIIEDSNSERRNWSNGTSIIAYRIIEPHIVPLEPEDVTPFTRFRVIMPSGEGFTLWAAPSCLNQKGVVFAVDSGNMKVSWSCLMSDYERNDSMSLGKWDANAWGPCSKESTES